MPTKDFSRLDHGMDFRGDFCGQNHLLSKKYVYWPEPSTWGVNVKICVEKCPATANIEVCLYDQTNSKTVQGFCKLSYESNLVGYNCMPSSSADKYMLVYDYISSSEEWWIDFAKDVKITYEPMLMFVIAGL
jgi:hypothetical protein